ncbi:YraN family protein [Candidatus Woesebacteria bacterium]|nr:YraN family protein [Candidatus Woesebacteria bacterium]
MNEPANEQLKLKKRKLTPKQRKLNNFATGEWAEDQAKKFLQAQRFEVLDQNVRVKNNEVDLIAFDHKLEELVFIEVKSRTSAEFGDPFTAVDRMKLRSMQYVAACYRRQTGYHGDFRFDIITVVDSQVHHYENITWNRR